MTSSPLPAAMAGNANLPRPPPTAFVPPAPVPPPRDLSWLQLLLAGRYNTLRAWPARAYRDLLGHWRFLGTDCYLISDPAAARQVLSDIAGFVRPVSIKRLLRPGAGNGLLTAEGAEWRRQRRILAPIFTPRHVEALIPLFAAAAVEMVSALSETPRAQLGKALERVAIDVAGRSIFSIPLVQEADRIVDLLRSYFSGAARAQIFDFLAQSEDNYRWFTWRRRLFSRRWFREIDALVQRRGQRIAAPGDTTDMFEVLLSAQGSSSGTRSDHAAIREQIASMLAAGFETTARAMFWTVYLLSHATDWQSAIRTELRAFPPSALRSLRDLERWPNLRSVLLEALRLYPPTPIISRMATADTTVLGLTVRAGSLIIVCPWIVHRHQRLWEAPCEFRPERFANNPQAYLSRPGYMPFGIGSRSCPAGVFAIAEATMTVAHLLADYEISLESDRPVMPVAIITTIPDHEPWFRLRRV